MERGYTSNYSSYMYKSDLYLVQCYSNPGRTSNNIQKYSKGVFHDLESSMKKKMGQVNFRH